jgi:TPR repeat protein
LVAEGGTTGDGAGVEKDAKAAVEWFRKSAEQGFTDAQVQLSDCNWQGAGTSKDSIRCGQSFID